MPAQRIEPAFGSKASIGVQRRFECLTPRGQSQTGNHNQQSGHGEYPVHEHMARPGRVPQIGLDQRVAEKAQPCDHDEAADRDEAKPDPEPRLRGEPGIAESEHHRRDRTHTDVADVQIPIPPTVRIRGTEQGEQRDNRDRRDDEPDITQR